MKRFFVVLAALGLSAAVASAQDFNAAVDAFNAGAQAMETNKTEALAQFRSALEQAQACTEEEAPEFVAKCKNAIVGALLSIAKEQINEDAYDQALATLAEAKTTAAEYEEAEAAQEVATLIPNVYMRKGATQLKAKDAAGAAATFKELVALNPEDGQANLLLGQALMQSGNMGGAIESLSKANELGEANAAKLLGTAYLREGQAFLKAGKNNEAVEALEKSNSFYETGNAYKLMASAYTKAGKSAKAIETYKKYLTLEPKAKDAADIMFTIAATAQKAGDKATAKEYYGKLAGTKYAAQAEAQLKAL
ncbi:MAG: tetratricopeptide repeat protein [Bacteroidales bacterium]|nr:tetratricopeptide repeat protein [Bacteroidales bacterium]MBQ9195393.1 tetratricopeptide repeat protein [Bacteroidales bacterium]